MDIMLIGPEHAAGYLDILERTSEEDRYCRFFFSCSTFTRNSTAAFVTPSNHMLGFIAHDRGLALGAGHAFIDEQRAEISLLVAQDSRRRGVGRALMARLMEACATRQIQRLTAYSLADNIAMRKLARESGFETDGQFAGIVSWTKGATAVSVENKS